MTTALLVIAVLAAASLCPLMMWWSSRRGRAPSCCLPGREQEPTVEDLRRRQAELGALISEYEPRVPRSRA